MDRRRARPRKALRPRGLRTLLTAVAALGGLLGALVVLGRDATASAADNACMTSGPSTGAYEVTVCITVPAPGAIVKGDIPVTATVSTTGGSVQRVVFSLGGKYLLTDFSPDKTLTPRRYGFTLRTTRFGDGSRSLAAEVLMVDGFDSSKASISLKFANGQSAPPPNTRSFQPAVATAAPGQPLVVAAVGDGAGGDPSEEAVVSEIAAWNPDLLLYLGDVYMKGSPAEFDNWYGHGDPSFYGRFRSITNPAIGNHEYDGGAAPGYFDYWDNAPHYYSFDARGWHFVSLDSTSQLGEMDPGSAQYEWLSQDLASKGAACTIVYFHHPLFNVGEEGSTPRVEPVWRLLAQRGVDIVLNGHDHTYQRWMPLDADGVPNPQGVTEFVVGTGGHSLQYQMASDPRLAGSSFRRYGALKLELGESGAGFTFTDVEGVVRDSGFTPCSGATTPGSHPPEPPPPPPTPPTPTVPEPPVLPAPVVPGPAGSAPATPDTGAPGSAGTVVGPAPTPAPTVKPAGGTAAPRPSVRLLARRLASRSWGRLPVRYRASGPGRATVTVLRGQRRITVVSGQARQGRNLLMLRAPVAAGRYTIVLTLRRATGAPLGDRGVLTVRGQIAASRSGR
jgi:calcineurin-like phosphoesterase family protein/Big-like domain-containing protein